MLAGLSYLTQNVFNRIWYVKVKKGDRREHDCASTSSKSVKNAFLCAEIAIFTFFGLILSQSCSLRSLFWHLRAKCDLQLFLIIDPKRYWVFVSDLFGT